MRSKAPGGGFLLTVLSPLWPVLQRLWPNGVITSEELGRAMILAARQGTLGRAGALLALVAAGTLVYATAVLVVGALEVRQLRRLVEPRPPGGRT